MAKDITRKDAYNILTSMRAFLMEMAVGNEQVAIKAKHLLSSMFDVIKYINKISKEDK